MSGVTGLLVALMLITLALTVVISILSEYHYRQLVKLPPTENGPRSSVQQPPSVAIIVPARNERAIIQRVVSSLKALHYPNFQITVVDDDSDDDTGYRAQQAGANVLCVTGKLPPGWTGKCNACHYAVRYTNAEWLLFTDADTYHQPDSLRQAIDYAERCNLDALSLLLRQECGTFWERLVLPLAYQKFFSTLRNGKPAFNGQYILIRRRVYEASGGFAAVRGRVMEDVALATTLAEQGYRIQLLDGYAVASVRMYQGLPALLSGMTKTAFTAARDRGWEGFLLASPFLMGTLTLPIFGFGLLSGTAVLTLIGLATILVTASSLIAWLHRFGVKPAWLYAALSQLGIMILFGIGFVSTLRVLSGLGVRWKGRTIIETRLESNS